VLRDAPLDNGTIKVERVEHVPHLRKLRHLRDAQLDLIDAGEVDDLAFLRDAPSVTTMLQVKARGSVDLATLVSCSALDTVNGTRRRGERRLGGAPQADSAAVVGCEPT